MISSRSIQQAYIDLYIQLRKFIWDIAVVDMIADIELNCYSAFPDIEMLKNQLAKLRSTIYTVYVYYEDLQKAFEDFDEILNNGNDVYVKLFQVEEVTD